MTAPAINVLLLVLALQAKHLFADFYLQNDYMLSGRTQYLHFGRLLHCVIHGVGTAVVLAVFGTLPLAIAVIVVAEVLVHYQIDWGKAKVIAKQHLTPSDAAYWHATGVDQALHQATYIVIAAVWLKLRMAS